MRLPHQLLCALTGMAVALAAQAQSPAAPSAPPATAAASSPAANAAWTAAEVRRVDRAAGKVTLRHEAIAQLDMPPMTMVFRVTEAAMLEVLAAGDRVRFTADKIRGEYTVTQIEKASP